jgi:hypothetical protein
LCIELPPWPNPAVQGALRDNASHSAPDLER